MSSMSKQTLWWPEKGMGRGNKWEGVVMGQLALSKGPARTGNCYQGQRADIPSKGLFHTIDTCALDIIIT
jgi:hypothetical protein